jgi:anaerobic selenocysteine-containing dehydrogenase/Fe-S-cluster-containing dehydrogenase component
MKRRDFFRIVTTSGAAAAVAGCQQSAEHLVAAVVPNPEIVPGVASYYATVCRECPSGCGVLARNRDGRVVKVEGNPEHPVSQGALCVRGQASLQGLYSPDRFAGPQRRDGGALRPVAWDDAIQSVVARIGELRQGGKGRSIVLMSQLETSHTGALLDRWTQAIGARPRVMLEPFAYEAIRAANRQTFGRDAIPYYALGDAEVILSFGADWAETWLEGVGAARGFTRMHSFREGRAGTVIHVEPRQSLTASNADQWIRNAPGTEGLLALAMLKVMVEDGLADPRFRALVDTLDVNAVSRDSGVAVAAIKHAAEVFARAKPGLAIGGGMATLGSNATATLAAINLLNVAAGNIGKTVRFGPDSAYGKATPYAEVAALVEAMGKGEIELLLLGAGVNPAFTLPGGLKAADAIRKVPMVVSFANQPDETTALAHLILPDTHWLESWGDYSPRADVVGLLQPTMAPIRDSRQMADVLIAVGRAALGAEEGKGPLPWASMGQYVRESWEAELPGQWPTVLQQGGTWGEVPPASVTAKVAPIDVGAPKLEGEASGFALWAYPSFRLYDGRGAVSSWLQETPDTMTQVVWDAWVEVPAEAASKLGIARGDVVRVSSPHGSIELPAYVSTALHPGVVAVPIGQRYAPYQLGRYTAPPPTGQNPVALLPRGAEAGSGGPLYLSTRVTLAKTGARRPLAVLQATHDQDHRELAQHVDLRAAREQALRGKAMKHDLPSLYPPLKYPGYRWGMAVDVDACVGCQACVVACQAENNVPVVGKAQAAYGRQLQWIRIERWAEGKPEHPEQTFLPMFCQHCEVAPCEPVCPVFAAYRTEEGLNGQVYNRCVGTRYCGNNCPYHVRRFNWYNYEFPAPLEVQLNPDVTVRQLGVMEKCTMCIQRIMAGKDRARDEKRAVRDGDILTACQQTCPTQAITFGNLKNEASEVAKLSHAPRAYHVLEEVGTRPSVTYLKKVVRTHA